MLILLAALIGPKSRAFRAPSGTLLALATRCATAAGAVSKARFKSKDANREVNTLLNRIISISPRFVEFNCRLAFLPASRTPQFGGIERRVHYPEKPAMVRDYLFLAL